MNRMAASLIVPFLLAASNSIGQTGPTLVGTGYSFPGPPAVAPGQIIRLQVTGLSIILPLVDGVRKVKAASTPLPTALAGISLGVTQYLRRYLSDLPTPFGPYSLPLLDITQQTSCVGDPSPGCFTTILTVQMPYELSHLSSIYLTSTQVVIAENGIDSQAFSLSMAGDQIHVVTGADNGLSANGNLVGPILTHADGTSLGVTQNRP